ncbi:hypothetical protein AB6W50_26670 [Klebsiella pneumoniae]|uniref:hypothetical protein n=1 Tax=Klebsiella pneumoniae TaxID=573 RepID=UPI0034E22761
MASKLNEGKIMQALNWAYDKALDGTIPGTNSSYEMAENYLKGEGDLTKKVNSLIRWQNTKSATTGFVSGLGGIITLPVSIPASIATVMYVQISMIRGLTLSGTKTHVKQRFLPLTPLLMVSDVLWSPVLPA